MIPGSGNFLVDRHENDDNWHYPIDSEFNVGDEVMITSDKIMDFEIGDVCEVVQIIDDETIRVSMEKDGMTFSQEVWEKDVSLVKKYNE